MHGHTNIKNIEISILHWRNHLEILENIQQQKGCLIINQKARPKFQPPPGASPIDFNLLLMQRIKIILILTLIPISSTSIHYTVYVIKTRVVRVFNWRFGLSKTCCLDCEEKCRTDCLAKKFVGGSYAVLCRPLWQPDIADMACDRTGRPWVLRFTGDQHGIASCDGSLQN